MHAAYPMKPMAIRRLSLAVFPRKVRRLTEFTTLETVTQPLSLLVEQSQRPELVHTAFLMKAILIPLLSRAALPRKVRRLTVFIMRVKVT